MKTITKLALTSLAAAVLTTGGAFASGSEWLAIDNHHGSFSYVYIPAQKTTTVAVYAHGKAVGRANGNPKRGEQTFNQITTAHGNVSYFAPVE